MNTSSNRNTIWLIYGTIIAILGIHFETLSFMARTWNNDDSFTHGFLIIPISFWLIWQHKTTLDKLSLSPEPKAILLIFLSSFSWYIARIADIQVIMQFSLIAIILSSLLTLSGFKIFKLLLFPFLFLFLSVPFGKDLIPVLMDFTANFTVYLISALGIPIYQDGLYFTLPSGNWSVVEACSGLNYLIASITLGLLYAYQMYTNNYKRSLFVIVIIAISILANGFRAFGIVMIGHLSKMQYGTGDDHTFYGWIFYGLVIFLIFYIGSFWGDEPSNKNIEINETHKKTSTGKLTIMSLTGLIIIFLPTSNLLLSDDKNTPNTTIEMTLPDNFNEWQFTPDRTLNWKPNFTQTQNTIHQVYQYGHDLLQVSIAYYPKQQQGSEAINSSNILLDKKSPQWHVNSTNELQTESTYVKESELSTADTKLLVWNWYQVGDYLTPNPYIAKLLEIYNKIFLSRSDISIVVLSTRLSEDKKATRAKLESFINTNKAQLKTVHK